LQEQASGLSQVVSVFRLDSSQAVHYVAPPQRTAPARQHAQPPKARQAIAAPRRSAPSAQPQLVAAGGEWEEF
ncbi:MAG: methyl-accepting chemotaxis protein, partial [Polaromonas sp.]